MKVDKKKLAQFLEDSGLATLKEMEQAQRQDKQNWEKWLVDSGILSEDQLGRAYAYTMGIPYIDLANTFVPKNVLQIIPESIARKNEIVAFEKENGKIRVAMIDPENLPVLDFIRKKTGARLVPCLTSKEALQKVLLQYQKSLQVEFNEVIESHLRTALVKHGESKDLEKVAADLPVVKIVELLIRHAIRESASDIHIEPKEKGVGVRYRIDGILHDVMLLPKEILSFIVARIKVLSGMKLDEHRLPQDGRFKTIEGGADYSFRVSVVPVYGGEKIVMRILNESSKGLTLEQVGMEEKALEIIQKNIRRPHGMVLISGPTGSGKTTTLYTMIDLVNDREVNISTVEDPIEYRMPGVNQTQINPKIGLSFSVGLRAILRQDPNIIMVGEIRDGETASIAAHAAMTGHLVFSTIHTNSAATAFLRLMEMGIESFLVATTVNVVIGQRLVRRICPHCGEAYQLTVEEAKELEENLAFKRLLALSKTDTRLKTKLQSAQSYEELLFQKGKGCDRCNESGYKGRIGIFEVFEADDEIKRMISKEANAIDLEAKAQEKGMVKMFEDGLIKAVLGITSLEEVMRVTKE